MIVNSRMARLMECSGAGLPALPAELVEIVDGGWMVMDGGALALAELVGEPAHVDPDRVGRWELDTNDIRIPDDDLLTDPGTYLTRVAARGLAFAAETLRSARGLPGADALIAVIGTGTGEDFLEHGTTVKLFTRRGDYPRWFDDLESFEQEAMAVLEATDVP